MMMPAFIATVQICISFDQHTLIFVWLYYINYNDSRDRITTVGYITIRPIWLYVREDDMNIIQNSGQETVSKFMRAVGLAPNASGDRR